MIDIHALLDMTRRAGASDLHLGVGRPPVMRIDGRLRFLDMAPLTEAAMASLLAAVADEDQRHRFAAEQELDFSVGLGDSDRYRINAFQTRDGLGMALRRLPTQVPDLADLGAPSVLADLAGRRNGLILVTGPTGSGKTTTIAAMIAHIAASQAKHVLTIEDPIEYVMTSSQSLISQREVGRDSRSFQAALRAAMREDPDIIVVGEMRDLETIRLAMTAAETGHLVLSTLHTSSCAKAVDRIIDVFPGEDKSLVRSMLSTSLAAVIAQTLIPARAGGRVAAFEVMVGTPAIRNLIRENKVQQMDNIIKLSSKHGMQTMRDAVVALLEDGRIAIEDADRVVGDLDEEAVDGRSERPIGFVQGPDPASKPKKRDGFFF